MRILKPFLILFLLVAFYPISAQNCNSYIMGLREDISVEKLCPEDMLDDLQKLRDALDKIHPDLYHYITKEQLDSAYRKAIKKVSNEMTAYEFSKTVASFLASIKDSHTNYNPQSLLFIGPKNKGTIPFFLIKLANSESDISSDQPKPFFLFSLRASWALTSLWYRLSFISV